MIVEHFQAKTRNDLGHPCHLMKVVSNKINLNYHPILSTNIVFRQISSIC